MKNNIAYILFIFVCTLLTGCLNDHPFDPVVDVTIPPHTSRLIIRADWTSGSDSLTVFVSKSRGVLDKKQFNTGYNYDTVANTKVEILRNGQPLGILPYLGRGYHSAKGLFKLDTTAGVVYTIRVSAPTFETVEASQTIQKKLIIELVLR